MKKIVFMMAALSLVACSKGDDKSKSADVRELVKKPALNQTQKDEIKTFMTKARLLPSSDLFFTDSDVTELDKKQQQKEISELSAESKQIFDKIQSSCQIAKPAKTSVGSQSDVGDKTKSTVTLGIDGEKCPIAYKEHSESEIIVLESNAKSAPDVASLSQTKTSTGSTKKSMKILTADLQSQIGYKAAESTGTNSSTNTFKSGILTIVDKSSTTTMTTTAQDRKIESVLVVERKSEIANIFSGTPAQKSDLYIKVEMQFPSSNPTIQIFRTVGETEGRLYVNGELYSRTQIVELFGTEMLKLVSGTDREISKSEVQEIVSNARNLKP